MARETWYYSVRPLRAARQMGGLREDPEDLVGPARFFLLVGGHDDGRTYRRAVQDPAGQQALLSRRPLPEALFSLDALRALPAGSLGRAYADHLEANELDPRKIVESTRAAYADFEASELHDFVRVRTRDVHDLVHALTGYGTDFLGETAVVAFTFANFGNRGYLGLAVSGALGLLGLGRLRGLPFLWDAYRRGRRAKLLWGADWEALLPRPLEEVRAQLGVEPVPPYEPVDIEDYFRMPQGA